MNDSDHVRDPAADEVFLDAALREVCSERAPREPERVLSASAERRAAAAAAVDAAAGGLAAPQGSRGWLLAAAFVLAASTVAFVVLEGRPGEPSFAPERSVWVSHSADVERPDATPEERSAQFSEFIDRFHRVMPRQPTALRDPGVRRSVAPGAVPVLRQLDDFLTAHLDEATFADRRREFRIYALALGDEVVEARVRELARSDRVAADLLVATADLIRANDQLARDTALQALERSLELDPPGASAAMRCALIAADLDSEEARRLSGATTDTELAARLADAADWAARDPRARLRQPLVLEGELVGGERFSTRSLRGRVVIVHFWASWSAACDYAMPDVLRARMKYFDQGVTVVGVSCDRDPAALRDYLARHPEMSWAQLFDADRPGWHPLATELGVQTIPRVFLIDREGVLRSVDAEEDLMGEVERLLGR